MLYCIDSLAHGGAERSLIESAGRWVASGIELHVLLQAPSVPTLVEALCGTGAIVHDRSSARGRADAVRNARQVIRAIRPDLVHTTLAESDLVGRTAAWLCRVPVTSSIVNLSYDEAHRASVPDPRRLRAFQVLDAVTARRCGRLHAVSEAVRASAAATLRYPIDRIDVIPRGRDVGHFPPATPERRAGARRTWGWSDEGEVVLCVASHEHRKGLDRLLRAWPDVVGARPSARLVILGRQGSSTQELQRLIASSAIGDSVQLASPVDDVSSALLAADVFVLPSRREGFPGSVIEAMATGLPVVASDIGPVREAVGDIPDRWLVDADDAGALAAAICDALDRPGPHSAAVVRAQHFSADRMADEMARFFDRAISGRG